MLANARLQTIVWTANIERAAPFYGEVLGLTRIGESHGAAIFAVGDQELRVSPVPSTAPSPHTVVGFAVESLDEVVGVLVARGVAFERFPHLQHDARGVWRAPDATEVAWLRDPDGNLLSIVRYAPAQ